MEVTTTKCDICGKKADTDDYNEPKGWFRLKRQDDRDKDFWARHRDICDNCGKVMSLLLAMAKGNEIRKNKLNS